MRGSEDTFQAIETAILNTYTFNETRFRFRCQTTDQRGGTAAPTISVLDAFSSGGAPGRHFLRSPESLRAAELYDRAIGAHTVRFGGLMRGVSLIDQSMQNYAGTFTFTSLDSYRLTRLGIANGLTVDQIRASGGGASKFSLAVGNPLAA